MLTAHAQLLAQHLSMDKDWEGKKKRQEKEKQKQLFYKAFTFPESHDVNCIQLTWTLL